MSSFEQYYTNIIGENGWQADDAQRLAVRALSRFAEEFSARQRQKSALLHRLVRREKGTAIRGVYLYGGVGRGKTFIMDGLVDYLHEFNPVRLHFHRFMIDVHDALNALRQQEDPLEMVANDWAKRTQLLCFDEFFVSDIADAMILGRFASKLFDAGVSLVATSNIAPDDLYSNGLSRELFLPAIGAIKHHCEVVHMDSDKDYRMMHPGEQQIWYDNSAEGVEAFKKLFYRLAGRIEPSQQTMVNRRMIPLVVKGVSAAWFRFDELCDGYRAAADYVELSKRFQYIFIDGMYTLSHDDEDAARRFVALVDEAYDRSVKLLFHATCEPKNWYQGKKLVEVVERTNSRLQEMQSVAYWQSQHKI